MHVYYFLHAVFLFVIAIISITLMNKYYDVANEYERIDNVYKLK